MQTTTCRHQLSAVPPVLGRAASSASGPGPDIMPNITPPIFARVRACAQDHARAACPDCKASHADCTVQHRTPPSTDAQTPEQARPAQGPPAALPVAGPSRGGGRTRGGNPSRALPRKAAATRGGRHQTFTIGTGPARCSIAISRPDGHALVDFSAAAVAVVLSVRRPPNSCRRALREFQWRSAARRLAGRRASPPGPACRHQAGSKPGKSAFLPRERIQKGHRKRSERLSQAFRRHKTLQSQNACPCPPQAARRRKRPPLRPPAPHYPRRHPTSCQLLGSKDNRAGLAAPMR